MRNQLLARDATEVEHRSICDVSKNGKNSSLGKWFTVLRGSYKEIQNNQKPKTKLSDEQIQRLNDAGFKWSLRKANSGFDKRFIVLKSIDFRIMISLSF